MPVSDAQMVAAWEHVLGLSKLEAGQSVTILTGPMTHEQTLRTALVATEKMGAVVNRLDMLPKNGEKALSRDLLAYLGDTPLTGNAPALAMLKSSDMVLDLMTLLFSNEQVEILESGTKILLAVEPPEILLRMLPQASDKELVENATAILTSAKTMRVTSKAGTDVTFGIGDFPVTKEWGFVDEPGRWDHWPSGFCATFANEGSSNGTIVIDTGDILLPQKCYVNGPIRLTVKNGFITEIAGGVDAALLKEYMESFDDPEVYAISHIGWGTQTKAHWSTLGFYDREQTIGMDARAFAGNFLFSTGPNNEAGGSRTSACHIDIPMRNCTVKVGDRTVVEEGKVVLHKLS
ncbi:2,5-dihydroxypyridine 5,6-dioxygenase [Shinella sp. BYT-45]|uniref:2,5-dihydroxypyridine 5,6-dioxygenase n=1 Tax=Shinella sp. BYT-45 TaxID=3377377 RepID=UPI003980CC9A